MRSVSWLVVLMATLWTSALVHAAPVMDVPLPGGYLDVEYFAGAGENTAYFVVDFGGNGGDTYAFGYHWNGVQTAEDAMFAIAAAGDLSFTTNNFGSVEQPNLFLALVSYGSESDEPDFGVDGRFWSYSLGTYAAQNVTWSPSDYGISGRNFSTGDIEQFIADGGFHGTGPSRRGLGRRGRGKRGWCGPGGALKPGKLITFRVKLMRFDGCGLAPCRISMSLPATP